MLHKEEIFREITTVCFVRDVLFDARFMFTISHKSSSKIATFVDAFVSTFKCELRTKWNPKIIPVSCISEEDLVVDILGEDWSRVFTLKCYKELFSRANLLDLKSVTSREEKASTYAIKQMEDISSIIDGDSIVIRGVLVLPHKGEVIKALADFGVFRDQHVNDRCVCLSTSSILHGNNIYIPSDFMVTWEGIDFVLDSLKIITSEHNSAIRKERALQNNEIKKLTKTDGKLAVKKDEKKKIKITSESQLSTILKVSSTTTSFGPGNDMEFDGAGMRTFLRYSITLRNRNENIALTKCSERVTSDDDKIDLIFLLKCCSSEFREPEPNLCAKGHVDRILQSVLQFSSTILYKFTDSEAFTFDLIRAYAFSVGHCGYISSHIGNLDDPYQTLNCMSSSLRLRLLLMRLGYTCYVYRNGHHAFLGVVNLLRRQEETLIECTVSNPGLFHHASDHRIRESRMSTCSGNPLDDSFTMPSKRRKMHTGSKLQYFL